MPLTLEPETLRSNPAMPALDIMRSVSSGLTSGAPRHSEGHFAPLEDLTAAENAEGHTRVLTGDGTGMLRLRWEELDDDKKPIRAQLCTRVDFVSCGGMEIPFSEDRIYPSNIAEANAKTGPIVREPFLKMDILADGTPVLLRAQISGDGIWTKDAKYRVTGEWEDVEKKEPARKSKAA